MGDVSERSVGCSLSGLEAALPVKTKGSRKSVPVLRLHLLHLKGQVCQCHPALCCKIEETIFVEKKNRYIHETLHVSLHLMFCH